MRRILLVSNRVMHYRVGIYNYFYDEFRNAGWEFSVVSDELQSSSTIPLRFPFSEVPFRYSAYMRHIDEVAPDVVIFFLHLHDRIFLPLIHRLKFSGPAIVTWTKTRNLDDPDNRLRNFLFDYTMRLSDGIIVYASSLLKNVPKSSVPKAFVANNTIDYSAFPPVSESKEDIKRSLGLRQKKLVLFVGRIGELRNRKKVDHIIDIFREIDEPDYGLVIVGSGMPEAVAKTMNSKNSVYLGEVQDETNLQISRIFKACDICCVPGHVGLSINQAFFWGLPMLTEDHDQPPEAGYLRDGFNGYLVGKDDRQALKRRLLELLENDELRKTFSDNARKTLFEDASIEGMFEGFLKCVEFAHSRTR